MPHPARFWTLVVFELALMGVASGRRRGARPHAPARRPGAPRASPTPAERLTGAPLPPELTPIDWLTAWNIDLLWAFAAGFGVFFYLAGVWRLRRRGDAWPRLPHDPVGRGPRAAGLGDRRGR